MEYDLIIIGGGAAGFFAAIHIAELDPSKNIAILERGKEVLTKVKISGGGRCNVTHAEFDPKELVKNYPRGEKELRGPFHNFCSGDTIAFFEERGIELKIEEDGRMFPTTDSSQTIIDCFLSETKRLGVEVLKNHAVKDIVKNDTKWVLNTNRGDFRSKKLLVASGSNPKVWQMMASLGHSIVSPVPSLFTFNIKDQRITGLMGLSAPAEVQLLDRSGAPLMEGLPAGKAGMSARADRGGSEGPLLITHWGMSGPAILKLSAWGARALNQCNYQFMIEVNWLKDISTIEVTTLLERIKKEHAKKRIFKLHPFDLPKRLWQKIMEASNIDQELRWADISKKQLNDLVVQLTAARFYVNGKSTFKEEFVTAGGVELKEVDFKTYESKLHKNLYFAGEVLNIDAVTGGFNFQNAWTGAYIAAKAISEDHHENIHSIT
ncbi:NAD(P)/FAD-dependent oxidoreductase [Sungkyunkwania multivorans]|uniref:NAD(P)/FAD-dependent oxidoreductase n=1 Tax=Sungkyunkwania multivorans TaxID=1173618 RepID=A0ABW3D0H5_9FLAO